MDPRNHIKINQNFASLHALSSERPIIFLKNVGYIPTKQKFNEKLLLAVVSKLVPFSNIESTPDIQKTSHGLKPMKTFMQTLEK